MKLCYTPWILKTPVVFVMGSQVHSIVSHTRRFHHIERESRLQRGVNPKLKVPSIWIILSIWFYVHNKLIFLALLCFQELGLVNTFLLLDRLLCTFIILKLDNLFKIMLFLYFLLKFHAPFALQL